MEGLRGETGATQQLVQNAVYALLTGTEDVDPALKGFIDEAFGLVQRRMGAGAEVPQGEVIEQLLEELGTDHVARTRVEKEALEEAKKSLGRTKPSPLRDAKLAYVDSRLSGATAFLVRSARTSSV